MREHTASERMTIMASVTCGLVIAAVTFTSVRDAAAQAPVTRETRETSEIVRQDLPDRALPFEDHAVEPQRRQTVDRPPPAGRRAIRVRASGHASWLALAASETFDATVGSANAVEYGASGAVLLPRGFFVEVDVSHMERDGERVFVDNGTVFGLGIPLTVSMTPIDLTGGYRFGGSEARPHSAGAANALQVDQRSSGRRLPFVPYVGGGVGWLAYKETSEFAEPDEDVDERFTSYHLLGGVEVPLWRILGVAAEARYRWVPDALGESESSASEAFGETNLGGFLFRVKVSATF
jgi:opacity protein-like surface antigen